MQAWLASSLVRHYPATTPKRRATLALDVARGGRVSFQVAYRSDDKALRVTASTPEGQPLDVRIRRVGYVPMPHFNTFTPLDDLDGVGHIPGLVPDPLFPQTEYLAGPWETNAFWITVQAPVDAAPGRYPVSITLDTDAGERVTLTATVRVRRAVLPPRRDFPVTHWFYADALCDWYGVKITEDAFWQILTPYLDDVVAHGQDTLYVPLFTPPLDGVKTPTQLLHVRRSGERYNFNWSLVRRWVQTALDRGITRFEWTHLFTQWGVKHAIRIYENHGLEERLLWDPETGATSPTYRNFLAQFLPEFERFLRSEGLMERSFFHLSDEPHGEEHLANYRAARELLRELAPWMPVMDALSEIAFAEAGLTDIPIPVTEKAAEFLKRGIPAWVYYCCWPRGRYMNRLLDTPLVKVAMSGWLCYRLRARGFLQWGYNYWYKSQTRELIDPFTVTDGLKWEKGWAFGDPFLVYPGPDGPIDALRWEVFAESLQDYALLQAAGIDPDDPMLAEIIDFADFPRDEGWMIRRRRALFALLEKVAV